MSLSWWYRFAPARSVIFRRFSRVPARIGFADFFEERFSVSYAIEGRVMAVTLESGLAIGAIDIACSRYWTYRVFQIPFSNFSFS